MQDFPPDSEDIVVVASRLVGDDRRAFEYDGEPPEAGDLPDLERLRHENELVEAMKERGWRVTMVGGGAGSGDLRRFYFRKG